MARLRVLRTAKATLTKTLYVDETATPSTVPVAVTVSRLDGTVVQSTTASGPDADNAYSFVFSGSDVLDNLVVAWSATINSDAVVLDNDQIEVVGGFFWSIAEARASDPSLTNATKYPTDYMIEKRMETEDEAERICSQAFVPRFAREVLDGNAQGYIRCRNPLIRTVRKVSIRQSPSSAFVDLTADQLLNVVPGDDGVLRLDGGLYWPTTGFWWGGFWPMGRRNVIVEYEHGMDYPPPDVVRGSKIRFKSMVLMKNAALPDRAEKVATSETGIVTYSSPAEDRTGLPETDAAYARHMSPVPGFG